MSHDPCTTAGGAGRPRRFPGVHAVLYALFDARERLDRAAMRRQVGLCLAAGVDGVVVLGLATEAAKLTEAERRDVVAWAAEDLAGAGVPLGVTVYGNSLVEQEAALEAAAAAGAAWVILQPPSLGGYPPAELARGLARLAAATDLPVAVQNAPALMGRGLALADLRALVEDRPGIAHLKAELPVVQLAATVEAFGARVLVLGGQGGLEMVDALHAGCAGFVLAPDLVDHAVAIWRLWGAGDRDAAEARYRLVLPEIVFAMRAGVEHLVAYGKRVFGLRAGLPIHDRAPAEPVTPFGLAAAGRHAAALGPFGRRPPPLSPRRASR